MHKADLRAEDDDYERQPQRRRYEEPLFSRIRKQLLYIAESPLKAIDEEISSIAQTVAENYESDEELRASFLQLTLQLVIEQPFKIPFVAAVLVVLNPMRPEAVADVLAKASARAESAVARGEWREVKLLLKFLGGCQGMLIDDGVWGLLDELFMRAVDLQTASSEDVSGRTWRWTWICH